MTTGWKDSQLYHAWYQGCKGSVEENLLNRLEDSHEFVAEPKRDGIWVAAFGDSDGVTFMSRNIDQKSYSLQSCKALKGVTLFGELGYGSQESHTRRELLGRDFMDVFELGAIDYDFSVLKESGHVRRQLLMKFFRTLPHKVRRQFMLIPRWRQMFLSRYYAEPEGLILKHLEGDHAYVGDGEKVTWWLKAKKEKDVDMVIMDWERSSAKTKIFDGVPRVEHLICGMYVDGKLKKLTKVGSMTDQLSRAIAADFETYRGCVIALRHNGQFKSGALRHPRVDPSKDNPIREDKRAEECVFA